MNRSYRSVWNATKQAYVAAAETVSARGKPCSGVQMVAVVASLLGGLLGTVAHAQTPPPTTALPTGGQVSAGQASIGSSGASMLIQQSSERAAINWQSFNVGSNAQVQFQQPSSSSVTLNRVLSSDPSQIFGRITANGQVILSNPAGVYFGKDARVDVGGLIATTHGMTDADFMAGKNRFERGGSTGSVVNEGELKAALGGYIALLAPEVRNQGAVIAQMGTVALAAGEAVDLKFDSNQRLTSIRVEPSQIQALVDNRHAVQAPGGLVIISAQSLDRLVGGVVRNSGRIEANGLQQQGGRIVLSASKRLENSGSIAASATADGPAGKVEIGAPEIVNSGSISATGFGQNSAGSVAVQATNFTQTASGGIDLSAPTQGGQLKIEATGQVNLQGSVSAHATQDRTPAGATSQGGQVDIAAQGDIEVNNATLDASGGQGGTIALRARADSQPDNPQPLPDVPGQGRLAIMGNSSLSTRGRSGQGGRTTLLGDHIELLDTTRIDASGATGGGVVLVGGDWQGSHGVYQATSVTLSEGATIDASATDQGDGGTVVLWSRVSLPESVTQAYGTLLARGGANGGLGGRIETSGGTLWFEGVRVDTQAADGSAGLWLLDPYNFFFSASQLSTLASNLNTSNTTVSTSNSAGGGSDAASFGMGHVVFESDFSYSGSNARTLTVSADKDIWINGNISVTGTGALGLSFSAGDRVLLNGDIGSNGGAVSFSGSAVHFQKTSGTQSIITAGGSLNFNSANILLLKHAASSTVALDTGAGALNLGSGTVQYTSTSYAIDRPTLIYSGWGGATTGSNGLVTYGINIVAGREYTTRLYFWDSWDNEVGELHVKRSSDGGYDYYFQAYWTNGNATLSSVNTFSKGTKYLVGSVGAYGRSGWSDIYADVTFVAQNSGTLTTWTNLNQDINDESFELYQVRETAFSSNASYTAGGRALSLTSTTGQISGSKNFSGLVSLTVSTNNTASVLGGVISDAASLTKSGTGTLTLTANQSYTGATNISAGTLVLSNDAPSKATSGFYGPGALRIEPTGATFASAFSTSGWTLDAGLTGLTIGKSTSTANVTIASALSIAGPVSLYGGQVDVQQSLTAGGAVLLKATSSDVLLGGALTNTAATATTLTIEAERHIRVGTNASITSNTAAMATVLWADADKSGDGIVYFESPGITTRGGDLTFGKDGQTALLGGQTVRVGGDVFFQRSSAQTLSTSGGAINVYGETIVANATGLTIHSGNGNITLHGLLNSGNQYTGVQYNSSTWLQALDQADNAANSYLATVTSRLENSIAALSVNYNAAWLGARRYANGVWQWEAGPEQGQALTYTNWNPGEPNNCCTNINGLGYAGENALQFVGANGNWNDLFDNGARGATDQLNYYVRETTIAAAPVTINAGTGSLTIHGSVGGTKALASLNVTAASTAINGSALITSGAQSYNNALNVTSTGNLSVSATTLSVTNAGQGLQLKAAGSISHASSMAVNTNGGNVTYWADSDANGTGYVQLMRNASVNTGGGTITMGGGADIATGYARGEATRDLESDPTNALYIAGVHFRSGVTLNSGGGDITLRGQNVGGSASAMGFGVFGNGTVIDAGTGKLSITGVATGSGSLNAQAISSYNGWTLRSANTSAQAISLLGDATGVSGAVTSLGVNFSGLIEATGTGGGITITGKSGTATNYDAATEIYGSVLAKSGPITLIGENNDVLQRGLYFGAGAVLGAKALANVTSSSSNIALKGHQIGFGSALALTTSGTVSLLPLDSASSFGSAQTYDSNLALGAEVSGLTIGKSTNTADITLSSAVSVVGAVTVYGGNINVNANLGSTASGAAILLKASGSITQAGGVAVASKGGSITYWADSDGANGGYVWFKSGSSVTTTNQSGTITVSGGNVADLSTGFAMGATSVMGNGVTLDGVSMSSYGGNIVIRGKSATTATAYTSSAGSVANSNGIRAHGSVNIDSGTGTLSLWGYAQSGSGSSNGIELSASGATSIYKSASTATNAITFEGTTTTAPSDAWGVYLWDRSTLLASGGGGISITGNGFKQSGVVVPSGSAVLASGGTITLTGTGYGASYNAVDIAGYVGQKSGTLDSSSAHIVVTGDKLSITGNLASTGQLTLQSYGTSFASAFSSSGWTLGSNFSRLTLGRTTNTADVTIASGYGASVAGAISIYGGNLNINEGLTSTQAGAVLLLKATGNIAVAASKTLQTSGGNAVLWADSDGVSGAYDGYIALGSGVTIDTRTASDRAASKTTTASGGGQLVLAGGAASSADLPTGYATSNSATEPGVRLGTVGATGVTLYSGGGDLVIRGSGTGAGTSNLGGRGVVAYYTNTLNAGAGTLTLAGISTQAHGIEIGTDVGGSSYWNQFIAAGGTASSPAITLYGASASANTGFAGIQLGFSSKSATDKTLFQAMGTGGIQIDANRMALNATGLLSASGAIHINSGSSFNASSYAGTGYTLASSYLGACAVGNCSGSLVTSSTANITLSADTFTTTTSAPITVAGTGQLAVVSASDSFASSWTLDNAWSLGSTLTGLQLGKSVNTANITVARTTSVNGAISVYGGNITLNAALTATGTNTLTLKAGSSGSVSSGASGSVVAGNLLLLGGSVTLTHTSNSVGTLAASGVAGLSYTNSGALTLGTVGWVNGVSASGTVSIGTRSGSLTVSQNVSTTNASASALVLNAGVDAAPGAGSGGDLVVSGSATVSVGSGGRGTLYSGSISGSTGLATLSGLSAGTGRYRYNADESTNFSAGSWTALGTGLYAIYREQPSVTLNSKALAMTYGDALPGMVATGLANGDLASYTISNRVNATSGNIKASTTAYAITSDLAGLGYSVSGGAAGTLTVNAKALTLSGFTVESKVYDTLSTATVVTAGGLSGLLGGDLVSFSHSGASFADKNVGTGKTVTLNGLALTGTDAGNYSIGSVTTSANITPKLLTVTANSDGKTYDGAAYSGSNGVSYSGFAGSENASVLTGSLSYTGNSQGAKDAGSYAITPQGLSSSNYTLQYADGVLTIQPRTVTVSGLAVNGKAYDGTSGATVTNWGVLSGVVSGESLLLNHGTAAFASKNVARDGSGNVVAQTVTATGYSLGDGSAGGGLAAGKASNYVLASASASTTATIAPLALSISGLGAGDKVYDGLATAQLTGGSISKLGADAVTLDRSGVTAVFTSADVARNGAGTVIAQSVNVAGFALDGADKGNYSLVQPSGLTATITPKTLGMGGLAADGKTYDGTTNVNITGWGSLSGVLNGESLVLNHGTASFASPDAGTAIAVTASGYSLGNGSAGGGLVAGKASNYQLASTTLTTSANIARKELTISDLAASDKTYDGTTNVGISNWGRVVTGVSVNGVTETLGLNHGLAAFDSKDVARDGSGNALAQTVTASGYSLADGTGKASNYTLRSSTVTTTARIHPATLTVAVNDDAKFVTELDPAFTVSYSGFVNGETTAALGGTLAVTRSNAGTQSAGTYSGVLQAGGLSAGNYDIQYRDGQFTIVGADQLLVRVANSTNTYGSAAQYSLADYATSNLVAQYYNGSAIVTLPSITRNGSGSFTVDDGAGGSATFTLAPAGTNIDSNAGFTKVGAYQLAATVTANSNPANYGNAFVLVGSQTVTPKALAPEVSTAATTKTYDGTTSMVGSLIDMTNAGALQGDAVSVAGTGAFASRHAGTQSYTVSNLALTGADAGNYYISNSPLSGSGTIHKATLTLSAVADSKTYDGTTASSQPVAVSGLMAGDSISGLVQTFNTKNVTATTVAASGYTVGDGNGGNNYMVVSNTAAGAIAPAALTLTAMSDTKVYDSTTDSSKTVGVSGLVAGDTLGNLSQSFQSKNVLGADLSTLRVNNGYTLRDTALADMSGNYTVTRVTAVGTISPASLIVSGITAADKTYDGTTSATVTASNAANLVGLIGGDSVTLGTVTGSFSDKNAGVGKTVTLGYTLGGSDLGNYTVTDQASTTATIGKRSLTVSATNVSKTYDGTTGMSGVTLTSNKLVGDDVGISGIGSFDSVNAGNNVNYTLTVTGLSGADAGNYSLAGGGTFTGSNGTIAQRSLTVAANSATKTYDGQTWSGGNGLSYSGFASGEDASVLGGALAWGGSAQNARHAGSYTLSASGYTSSNYSIAYVNGTLTVNPATLTLTATTDTKVYDSTTSSSGTVLVSGLQGGDTLGNLSQVFASKHVLGAGASTLNVAAGYALNDGNGGGNYNVSLQSASGTITPRAIEIGGITASGKVYDGTTTAAVDTTQATGWIGGDHVTVSATGQYSDKHVGTSKVVSLTTSYSGTDVGNYAITTQATTTADITSRAITIGGITASGKVYDGTTTAAVDTSQASGWIAGDSFTVSASGTFADRNVGTGKPVSLSVSYGGADVGNYTITGPGNTTADIMPRSVTLGAPAASKVYDGSTVYTASASDLATLSQALGVAGDAVSGIALTFADKNVGTGKTVTASAAIIADGNGGANYSMAYAPSTQGSVSRLNAVNWVGGSSNNWFDPANWAGGAVPDVSNVAHVVIPAGASVVFGSTGVGSADATQPVSVERISDGGALTQNAGTLHVNAGGITLGGLTLAGSAVLTNAGSTVLGSLTQSGGSFSGAGDLTVTQHFSQGRDGSLSLGGAVSITGTQGGLILGNLTSAGALTVRSTDGAIAQASGTAITAQGASTFTATQGGQAAAVTLDEDHNDFTGVVMLTAGQARLTSQNALTAVLHTSGTTTLQAGGNLLVSGAVDGVGSDLLVTASRTTFGALDIGRHLTSTTTGGGVQGGVSQTGPLGVQGTAEFVADAGTLQDAQLGQANDFRGAVSFTSVQGGSWRNLGLNGGNRLTLGDVTATGQLSATAAQSLDLSGTVQVASLDLATALGSMGQSAGTLTVTQGPSLLAAGGDITLDRANDFSGLLAASGVNITLNTTRALSLDMVNASGNLQVASQGNLNLGTATVAGVLDARSGGGDIGQTGPLRVNGLATLNAGAGAVVLPNPSNRLVGGTSVQAASATIVGDGRAAALAAASNVLGGLPTSVAPGTGLSNAASPKPLVMGSGASPAAMSERAPSTSATVGSTRSTGVTIDLREAPTAGGPMMAAVSLPKGTATSGVGFNFELPSTFRDQVPAGGAPQASLPDGSVLPAWLKFDPQNMRFEASAVPVGAFPLQVVLQIGGQRAMVLISERTE